MSHPTPVRIVLKQDSRKLLVEYDDGAHFELSCEYLRVSSPSAEVQGHGPEQRVTVPGKAAVNIVAIHPIGRYAVQLQFDDGHNTGLYSWQTLYELGRDYEANWARYLAELEAAGMSRES